MCTVGTQSAIRQKRSHQWCKVLSIGFLTQQVDTFEHATVVAWFVGRLQRSSFQHSRPPCNQAGVQKARVADHRGGDTRYSIEVGHFTRIWSIIVIQK